MHQNLGFKLYVVETSKLLEAEHFIEDKDISVILKTFSIQKLKQIDHILFIKFILVWTYIYIYFLYLYLF